MEERRNEVEISSSEIKKIDINLHEVIKSVCKIIYKNTIGTGFFIKLNKDGKELFCLMTNFHVITKEMIETNEVIDVKYNYEKKLIQIKLDKEKRIINFNINMDISIIEILPNDKIKEKYFLLPNKNNNINYINKEIYIPQYPEGKNLSYSEGKIKEIDNFELVYDASTKLGSSGSPILLKNTIEVIGIHKQGNIYENENYGTLVYSFIETLEIPNRLINQKKFYENGSYYYGQMVNDLEHGKGKTYDMNGRLIYDGDFVKGKFEGNGIYLLEDEGHYIGQFLDGLEHGKGIIYDNKGNVRYEGDFVKGKYHGYGK